MVRRGKDGGTWRIGTDTEVAWIQDAISTGLAITAAIPPVFEAYATVVLPSGGARRDRHDRAVLALLSEQSPGQRWWLGYLDTGTDDIVFPDAPTVTLYARWHYVLVEAGPEQAATWRQNESRSFWQGILAETDVPRRPLVAGFDAVGRRLDLHRRTGRPSRQIPAPPRSAGKADSPRPGRHATRPPGAVTCA